MSDHVDRQFLPPCSFLRAIRSERKEYANQCLKRKIRDCWQSTDHVSCRFIFFLSVVVNLFRILSISSQLYFSPFVASQLIPFRPPGNCGHFHSVQGSLNYSFLGDLLESYGVRQTHQKPRASLADKCSMWEKTYVRTFRGLFTSREISRSEGEFFSVNELRTASLLGCKYHLCLQTVVFLEA